MKCRWLMIVTVSALLAACRLEIVVPEGGKVTTVSGNYECLSGERCVIEVVDALFDETFIGVPDQGYSFRWQRAPGAFCGGKQTDCRLSTVLFADNNALLGLLETDLVLFLKPKFWTADQPEVSGLGSGTVSGFGSVIVNDDTTLTLDDSTSVSIDDDSADDSDLRLGMVVEFQVGDDSSPDLATGTAISVVANNAVKGPVTSVSPLQVLSQTIIATGSTVLDDLPSGQLSALNVGDILEVAGHRGGSGEILATRIEFKPLGTEFWKIVGPIANLSMGSTFSISGQEILTTGAIVDDCPAGLSNGTLVEVKANPDAQFAPGAALASVAKVECLQAGLSVPGNTLGFKLPAEIEGVVGSIVSPQEFLLAGQLVQWSSATEFRGGTVEDLIAGVRLEAEGTLNTETGTLLAREIKFKERRVRIEAPLAAGPSGSSGEIELLGITIFSTSVTDDEDGVLAGTGGIQVEVRGYVDDAGSVIAEEVRERGESDSQDTRLRGPVSDIVPPTFKILGVLVDTSSAKEIRNANDILIGSAEFFGLISEGSIVSVQDALYDGASRLDQGKIEIED